MFWRILARSGRHTAQRVVVLRRTSTWCSDFRKPHILNWLGLTGADWWWWLSKPEAGGAKKQSTCFGSWRLPKHGKCLQPKWPVVLAWERRWTRMLTTTCAVAFAGSLVAPSEQCETWCRTGGEGPT